MPNPDQVVVDLHTKMFAHRITAAEACRRSGVNASTWSRWANGQPPLMSKLRKLEATVDEMIAEKDGPPAA